MKKMLMNLLWTMIALGIMGVLLFVGLIAILLA